MRRAARRARRCSGGRAGRCDAAGSSAEWMRPSTIPLARWSCVVMVVLSFRPVPGPAEWVTCNEHAACATLTSYVAGAASRTVEGVISPTREGRWLGWPGEWIPLPEPAAHRSDRPTGAARRHVVRRLAGPRGGRGDLRVAHHDPLPQPWRRDLRGPQAGVGAHDHPQRRPDRPRRSCAGAGCPLETVAGDNELVVDAVMRFRNDGEGLHRSVDPADGRHYVYGMSFMDAAPSVFACFDQPDLKAPYRLAVRAPEDWVVVANGPGRAGGAGVVGLRRDAAPVDVLRHRRRRALPPRHRRARRHPAGPLGTRQPGHASSRPTPTSCSP